MSATTSTFDGIRNFVSESGEDSRVEVNQRALIDKILARYATAGAVYRELLQNSNDAGAESCEIRFKVREHLGKTIVSEVVYRNNGMPFRKEDWHRLQKIAEGNPASDKVGFFGVGAYAMFSLCEEPMVVSGNEALIFKWRGDSLWARVGKSPLAESKWTSFVLPSRDPYNLPDLVEFGTFLCGNLTFLANVKELTVFVNDTESLKVKRSILRPPVSVEPPKASSWWARDGAVLSSPSGIFTLLETGGQITETVISLTATIGDESASVETSLFSAQAKVEVSDEMKRRIERVTKKLPAKSVTLQIVIGGSEKPTSTGISEGSSSSNKKAKYIVESFSPKLGSGRVFIGFRTSQTTGLGVHFSAPLIPTVEREAVDLIDPTLNLYNRELLFVGGILMRLGLEHSMARIADVWGSEKTLREKTPQIQSKAFSRKESLNNASPVSSSNPKKASDSSGTPRTTGIFGFAHFMASSIQKIADVVSSIDVASNASDDLLNPVDSVPLFKSERMATIMMRCFSPQKSSPDANIGSLIASGFEGCLSKQTPPVLTKSGVRRGHESRLPNSGIESFMNDNVVRNIVLKNSENYLLHVAQVPRLTIDDLSQSLSKQILEEEETTRLIHWWCQFSKRELPNDRLQSSSELVKSNIRFYRPSDEKRSSKPVQDVSSRVVLRMSDYELYTTDVSVPISLPMPKNVLPRHFLEKIPDHILEDDSLRYWYKPLPMLQWVYFIATHPCMTKRKGFDDDNLNSLSFLCKELEKARGNNKLAFSSWLKKNLSDKPCIPHNETSSGDLLLPTELYLPSAELDFFTGVELHKVSKIVQDHGITDSFLKSIGVRETVSMDVLFSQLESLKWNRNPLPLIRFLRKSELRESDFEKLRLSKYLPAAGMTTQVFSPSELCLPQEELLSFGFLRVLQWPPDEDLTERSADGKFLVKLGVKAVPPMAYLLKKCQELNNPKQKETLVKVLNFVSGNLGHNGKYRQELQRKTDYIDIEFIPTESKNPLDSSGPPKTKLSSITNCFLERNCILMGFPVVVKQHNVLAQRFGVSQYPSWKIISQALFGIVENAATYAERSSEKKVATEQVITSFWSIFEFLSTRTSSIDPDILHTLQRSKIIPVRSQSASGIYRLSWYSSSEVFFKNGRSKTESTDSASFISSLFNLVDGSPFLRYVGVKDEPGEAEICKLVIENPADIFKKCGHQKYKNLLKRIASRYEELPSNLLNGMKSSRCLIAVRYEDGESTSSNKGSLEQDQDKSKGETEYSQNVLVTLEKARNICIVDDAFLQRMFKPYCAPSESDLENLYRFLGCNYISKVVQNYHEVNEAVLFNTELTLRISERIKQRAPLLISPNVTHRPLVTYAEAILSEKTLSVAQVSSITATYKYGSSKRTRSVSCCSSKTVSNRRGLVAKKITIFVTPELDFFDLGNTVANLILQRSHLEDSFLFGTLLEAPISQLRSRGFPVDRVLKVRAITQTENQVPPPKSTPAPQNGANSKRNPVKIPEPAPQNGANSKRNHVKVPDLTSRPSTKNAVRDLSSHQEGLLQILCNKFPECKVDHIKSLIMSDKSSDTLKNVNKTLEEGRYPTKSGGLAPPGRTLPRFMGGSIGRLFRGNGSKGLKGLPDIAPPPSQPYIRRNQASPPRQVISQNEQDNQRHLSDALDKSVKSCASVTSSGVKTATRQVPINLEMSNSATCEVVEGKNLIPVPGPNNKYKTENGILVFSANNSPSSAFFDNSANWTSIERFSKILEHISAVFSLNLSSIALYYDGQGNTIAFNADRALHFNTRYFCKLHDSQSTPFNTTTFSYWFVVFCHELAHNFSREHGKEHGYYTESFCQKYQPVLFRRLATMGLLQ